MTIVISAARRTPIGAFQGAFCEVSATDLGVAAARAVLADLAPATGIATEIADVVVGNVLQAGLGMNIARQIAIRAGLPQSTPGQTVNRVCGSGLQAVVTAAQALKAGDGKVYFAGGTENMSAAPYLLPKARAGYRFGNGELVDSLTRDGLTDPFHHYAMGLTAENVASRWKISREEQDAYAVESQRRAAAAAARGAFQDEIVPVSVPARKGAVVVAADEHLRPGTTLAALAQLQPAFLPQGGTVTAGNASGLNDGAAMVAVTTEAYARAYDLPVLASVVSYAVVGTDPAIMGTAPALAIPAALRRAGLDTADIDWFELNEAFAAPSIAVVRDLRLDPGKVNPCGGAIALGHPIGASGARILVTLVHALRRFQKELGVASLCIGGGMGIAMVLRRAV
jgi:acetyl-CoA C-acetyltransferase